MKNVKTIEEKTVNTAKRLFSVVEIISRNNGKLTAPRIARRTLFKSDYALALIDFAIKNNLVTKGRYGRLSVV